MPSSSGHTCVARRLLGPAILLGLLAFPLAPAAFAQSAPSIASLPFALGYGASSMSAIANGVPVYTVGETVWAESGFSTSVSVLLQDPAGTVVLPEGRAGITLAPDTITPVYTFNSSDPDGAWNMTVISPSGPAVFPIHFVNPAAHQVSLGAFTYGLEGGNLSISSQANLGDSYDQEVCAAGPIATSGLTLRLPKNMNESGAITLNPAIPGISPVDLTVTGRLNETFTFWFELYHPYSLEALGTDSLVINNLMTAQSSPVTFLSAASVASTLTLNMPLREGRYELRAFFENSTSLVVSQTNLLIVNGSTWISLSSECPPEAVQSQNVSYSASLTTGLASWPNRLYLMYRTLGVEGVVSAAVDADVSSVDFEAAPYGTPLQNFTLSAATPPGVEVSQWGNSMFVLTTSYPVRINYSLSFSGAKDLIHGNVSVNGRDVPETSDVSLAKLTVHILSNQNSPTDVTVYGLNGVKMSSVLANVNETSSLYLPAGSYTVTGSQAGNSESAVVDLTDGTASSVTLDFNALLSIEIILVVTAIMAAGANVLVWVFRSRSLRSRLAGKQATGP